MSERKPDPSPFFLEGGPVGVMLIHGMTGSAAEMRRVGEYLHERGLTVSAPLLPGHGTTVEDMNKVRWSDWTEHIEANWHDLQDKCETVFVGGLSLGSMLSLHLAAHHPELSGALVYSPAIGATDPRASLIPVLKYLAPQIPKPEPEEYLVDPEGKKYLASYEAYPTFGVHECLKFFRHVMRLLPQVTCPLLVIHSTEDRDVPPDSAKVVFEGVGSTDKELVTLHKSGHVLVVDCEWETVAGETYRFVKERAPVGVHRGLPE